MVNLFFLESKTIKLKLKISKFLIELEKWFYFNHKKLIHVLWFLIKKRNQRTFFKKVANYFPKSLYPKLLLIPNKQSSILSFIPQRLHSSEHMNLMRMKHLADFLSTTADICCCLFEIQSTKREFFIMSKLFLFGECMHLMPPPTWLLHGAWSRL